MNASALLSQRLGFSNAQADDIDTSGIARFLRNSFATPAVVEAPDCMRDAPRTRKELKALKNASPEEQKKLLKRERERMVMLQHWWAERMHQEKYPLREKMVLFWHNHFVSAIQKVKLPWLLYEQNQLFREYAFGNFKTLTKKVLYNNAMLVYLDNVQNKARTPNENLSRELLELFTLGIGHYTEQDIKEEIGRAHV